MTDFGTYVFVNNLHGSFFWFRFYILYISIIESTVLKYRRLYTKIVIQDYRHSSIILIFTICIFRISTTPLLLLLIQSVVTVAYFIANTEPNHHLEVAHRR